MEFRARFLSGRERKRGKCLSVRQQIGCEGKRRGFENVKRFLLNALSWRRRRQRAIYQK